MRLAFFPPPGMEISSRFLSFLLWWLPWTSLGAGPGLKVLTRWVAGGRSGCCPVETGTRQYLQGVTSTSSSSWTTRRPGRQTGYHFIFQFFQKSSDLVCYTWGYPISPPRPSVVSVRFNGGQLCSGGQTCVAATTSTTSTTSSSDSPGCCGGESFTDLLCNDVPNDPHGGLGCKACGVQDCRLCGGPVYIPCP